MPAKECWLIGLIYSTFCPEMKPSSSHNWILLLLVSGTDPNSGFLNQELKMFNDCSETQKNKNLNLTASKMTPTKTKLFIKLATQ